MPVRIKAKKMIDGVLRVDGYRLVPCGKCSKCRLRRVNDWVLRLSEEERKFIGGLFVTLTYTSESVPLTSSGFMTLCKRDVQTFFKRLRKNLPGVKVKYYLAGEYGSKTKRPHYHIILFGCRPEDVDRAWCLDGKPIGDIHFGEITGASIAYTLKYISKERQVPAHANDDRVPEFSLMSKTLGYPI